MQHAPTSSFGQERGGQPPLRRANPTVKLAVALALSLLLTLVIDPVTPLLFLTLTCAAGWTLGGVQPRTYLKALTPLVLMALGFIWTNAAFARAPQGEAPLWEFGPVRVSAAGLAFGLGVGLRGLAIGALSITAALTTDPTDLVVSLVRHARVPYRIGYPLLAGLRFLPFFSQEAGNIRLARRVRGRARGGAWHAWLTARLGDILPLLSLTVRRAARIAVAMDSRAFAAARERTYFRDVPLGWRDIWFAVLALAGAAAILAAGWLGGWLRFWDGRFSA